MQSNIYISMYGRELFAFHIDVFNFLHRKIYFSPSIYPALPNYVYLFLLFFLPNSSLILQSSLSNLRKSLPFIPIQLVGRLWCKCHNVPEFTTDHSILACPTIPNNRQPASVFVHVSMVFLFLVAALRTLHRSGSTNVM